MQKKVLLFFFSMGASLRKAGYKLKFCTNESQITRKALVSKLRKHGFSLTEEEVHSPAPACRRYLLDNGLRPYLIGGSESSFFLIPLNDWEVVKFACKC